jgi:hypothetical protein
LATSSAFSSVSASPEALRHQEVFAHRQFMHRLRNLEGAPDAHARALVHRCAQHVLPIEQDFAAAWPNQA